MPLGILSDSDFSAELGKFRSPSTEPIIEGEIINLPMPGRKGPEVPEVIRTIIGDDAVENGNDSAKEIARALDISDSSLSAYKHGANSTATYNTPDQKLKTHIDNKKRLIITNSQNTILEALNQITPEKLEATKARDLAGIARDISATIKNLDEDSGSGKNSGQPLVIFAPMIKDESSFEVITAKD